MKSLTFPGVSLLVAIPFFATAPPRACAELPFRDDFDGDSLDLTKWGYQDRNWPVGQTWFKGAPEVSGGIATFEHHTYNPYDQDNQSCLSQEILSNVLFSPEDGLEVEARIRFRAPMPGGLVASMFLYTDEEVGGHLESEEIDFEFLSNQINDPPEPEGHRVVLAAYDDFWGQWDNPNRHWTANPVVPGLDLTQFNIFRIHWWSDRVDWYWEDTLIATIARPVPDRAMSLRLNFWAATELWPPPWDPNMQPARNPSEDVVSYYDVDYIVVTPELGALSLLGIGGLAVMRRRRH